MPRYRYIRVKGQPRHKIDVDLVAQAMLQHERHQRQHRQREGGADLDGLDCPGCDLNQPDHDDTGAGVTGWLIDESAVFYIVEDDPFFNPDTTHIEEPDNDDDDIETWTTPDEGDQR
ncbi:MAG: hypothetical protein ACRDQZ_05590 [Mycobacteriales bacterium]